MWLGSFNTVNGKRKKWKTRFNTVNGKRVHATCLMRYWSALNKCFNTVNGKRVHATYRIFPKKIGESFNTVNGKRVHATTMNNKEIFIRVTVSIP